jgi:predicted metalloprotease with PDZ domain
MLKSIDTFNRIVKRREELIADNADILESWKEYLSPYAEIKEKCLQDASKYNFDSDIKPIILDALTSNFSKLEIAHNNFIKQIDILSERFQNTFSISDDIFIYFYIGLCNGAGWATTINSQESVLLGGEKIVELNWYDEKNMIALMYHELCHVAHSKLRHQSIDITFNTEKENSIWQLYTEGFAQRYEQILYKDGFYHQDRNGWLSWCKDNHNKICKEYLNRTCRHCL